MPGRDIIKLWQVVRRMWFAPFILQMMGGETMKKNNSDSLVVIFTFGLFLLALLTFIFTFK